MNDQQDKPLPSFFQNIVDIAVARTRGEMLAVVEEAERRIEAEVAKRVEAQLRERSVSLPSKQQSRSLGDGSRAAIRAATAVIHDRLGTPRFPTSRAALATAIAETALALEGIQLDPDNPSVRAVAAEVLAGLGLAEKFEGEKAERERSGAKKSPEVTGSRRDKGQHPH